MTDISIVPAAKGGIESVAGALTDEEKKKRIHWELWRADVQVQSAHFATNSLYTNPVSRVTVYYEVDWSTNFMSVYGIDSRYSARRPFSTNQVISFFCFRPRWPEVETNGFHIANRSEDERREVFPTKIVH
jgi:hypothetical protein